jgi:ribosomal protein S18 acetylase RimI-like enzyme
MQIEIIQTKAEDNKTIASIAITCWKDAYKDVFPKSLLDNLSLEDRLNQRLSWFNLPNRYSIVAMIQNTIVGFCDYGESRRPQFALGEIYSLYVLPEYKGLGIGKFLSLKAMEHLNAVNLSPFIVTTLEVNFLARKFYEKLGFKEISHIMTEVGNKLYKEIVYLYEK